MSARWQAILLDLDGTLLDTVADIAAAINTMLAALGRDEITPTFVRDCVGQGVDVLLRRVLDSPNANPVDAMFLTRARTLYLDAYAAVNGRAATMYPGVVTALDTFAAQGLRLACVTNKPQRAAEAMLDQFDLAHLFGVVLGGDTVPLMKPAPAPLLRAAELLGVSRAACIVVGDSTNDARAARAAGMPIVLCSYGYREGLPVNAIDCDAVVDRIDELAYAMHAPDSSRAARFGFLRPAATVS